MQENPQHAVGGSWEATPELTQGLQSRRNPPRKLLLHERPWDDSGGRVGTGRHSPQQAGQRQVSTESRKTSTSYKQEPSAAGP